MKTCMAKFSFVAVMTCCWCLSASSAWAVQFPDKNLEAALRHYILDKREGTVELTDDDLKKIFIFEAKGKAIKDLTGLEKCPNIALINLAKNEVENITAIKDLKNLQSQDCRHCAYRGTGRSAIPGTLEQSDQGHCRSEGLEEAVSPLHRQ
jgi:hypothetical protein